MKPACQQPVTAVGETVGPSLPAEPLATGGF